MINYKILSDSALHYAKHGFEQIEVPWIVAKSITNITLPLDGKPFSVSNNTDLVGSAEQGFLQLVKEKKIKGKFQAISPCFRDDKEDELHQKYFMKNELFDNSENQSNNWKNIVNKFDNMRECIKLFFDDYIKCKWIKEKSNHPLPTSELSDHIMSFDLVDTQFEIELGSYGIRYNEDLGYWIYGTGCAEPRLSYAMSKYGK